MPLIIGKENNRGKVSVLIVLGDDSIERMKEKDPFEVKLDTLPRHTDIDTITISYASDPQMTQIEQLVRQGKKDEAMKMVQSTTEGFKFRPERGDHDLGPQRLG